MQPISSTKLLGASPKIVLTHKLLQQIRHLVDIAPQEAQWFHTIEYHEDNNYYVLDGMYIPEQVCSAAEVDSSPTMMVDFYKELAEASGPVEASNLLSNMGAWCHSHHNMNVSPSGQDVTQFTTMINNAIDQNNLKPQIMLIFNKQDQYYNRVWDPENDIIWENVPLLVQGYDFTHITDEANRKFKKKVYSKKPTWGWNKGKTKSSFKSQSNLFSSIGYQSLDSMLTSQENSLFDNHYEELFLEIYPMNKKYVNVKQSKFNETFQWYIDTLHESELNPLCYWLTKDPEGLTRSLLGNYDLSKHQVKQVLSIFLLGKDKTLISDVTTFLTEIEGVSQQEIPAIVQEFLGGL